VIAPIHRASTALARVTLRRGLTGRNPCSKSCDMHQYDDDAADVGRVADRMIARHGARGALARARDFHQAARDYGDGFSAQAWREIADAIEAIVQ